jgi:hypothetical protein
VARTNALLVNRKTSFDFLMDYDQPFYQDFGRLLLFPMSVIFGSGRSERTSNVTRENISHYMRRGAPTGDRFVSFRESGQLFWCYYLQNRYLRVLRIHSACETSSIRVKFYFELFILTRLQSRATNKAISYRSLISEARVRSCGFHVVFGFKLVGWMIRSGCDEVERIDDCVILESHKSVWTVLNLTF